jgi:hypothetical protein
MPKLTEESTQCFTPITKPSSDNTSSSTNVITPVPIHGNSTPTSTINQNQTDFNTNNGKYIYNISIQYHGFKPADRSGLVFYPTGTFASSQRLISLSQKNLDQSISVSFLILI